MDIINSMENLNVDGDDVATGYKEPINEHHHDQILRKKDKSAKNISCNKLYTKSEVEKLVVKTETGLERFPDNNLGKEVSPNEGYLPIYAGKENSKKNLTLSRYADTYTLENFKRNLLVIFNHEIVFGYNKRIGTEKDVERLTKTFENFGFKVEPINNPTVEEILSKLKELAKRDFTDYGCVAVAVFTHGSSRSKLKTKNDEEYSESEIILHLNSGHVSLRDKPKIIIIQACRGDHYSREISVDKPLNIPKDTVEDDKICSLPVGADMLVIHSTYAGKVSIRTKDGSWLIQTLCQKIDSLAYKEDLESILTHVKRNVALKRHKKYNIEIETLEIKKQMPVITSTLTRKLYLKKYQEDVYERSSDSDELQAWVDKMTRANFSTTTEHIYLKTPEIFCKFVTNELNWLKEKEEVELSRDWADPQINLPAVEIYYQQLMSLLVNREKQFKDVINLGETLIARDDTQRTTIESQLQKMRSQWAWMDKLTHCFGMHLEHTTQYHNFFRDVKQANEILSKCEEELNSSFSQSELTTEQIGDQYRRLSVIENKLHKCKDEICKLKDIAKVIRSVKQRKPPVTRSFKAETMCDYNDADTVIRKGSKVNVLDNSDINRWCVSLEDVKTEVLLPGAVVTVQTKHQEAIDIVERLRIKYERVWQLLLKKERRLEQDDMFDSIKLVKELDFSNLIAMGIEERQRTRQTLNNKANKFREKYNVTDPRTRRLFKEIDEVNKLFDECNRRDPDCCMEFKELLSLYEHLEILKNEFYEKFEITRDPDALEHLIALHKDWKTRLLILSNDVRNMEDRFKVNLESSDMEMEFNKVMENCNEMRENSESLVQMFTALKTLVDNLDENHHTIDEFENMLAQLNDLPSHVDLLKKLFDESPLNEEERISNQQIRIRDEFKKLKDLLNNIITTIPEFSCSSDKLKALYINLDKEISQQEKRWSKVREQLDEGYQRRDAAYPVLSDYYDGLQKLKIALESISNEFCKSDLQEVEPVWKLQTSVKALNPEIAKVNENGKSFIEKAKDHAFRCQSYVEWLRKEIHKSLNTEYIRRQAEIHRVEKLRSKGIKLDTELLTGWESVEKELKELNLKHQELLSMMNERSKSIAAAHPE